MKGKFSNLQKRLVGLMCLINVTMGTTLTALASGDAAAPTTTAETTDFSKVSTPIVDLINSLLTPILAIVGAVGTIYCVVLGVKFAKTEEPQEHEKAKTHLKNAIIGFVLIFILMAALKLSMPVMKTWVKNRG